MQGRKEGHAHTLHAYTRAFPYRCASSSAFCAYSTSYSHGALPQHSWGHHAHSSPPKWTPSQESGDHSYQSCTRTYQCPTEIQQAQTWKQGRGWGRGWVGTNMSQHVMLLLSSTHNHHINNTPDSHHHTSPNDKPITIPWRATPAAQQWQHQDSQCSWMDTGDDDGHERPCALSKNEHPQPTNTYQPQEYLITTSCERRLPSGMGFLLHLVWHSHSIW